MKGIKRKYSIFNKHIRIEKIVLFSVSVNLQEVQSSDMSWFSTLDSTRWLYLVSVCLTTACGVAEKLVDKNLTVVIRGKYNLDP